MLFRSAKPDAPALANLSALAHDWGIDVTNTVVVDASGMGRLIGAGPEVPIAANYPAHPKFGGIKPRLEESKKALAHLSADDQAWIFGKTALEFYPGLPR